MINSEAVALQKIQDILPFVKALVFHKECIEDENLQDKDSIKIHIDAMQEIENNMPHSWSDHKSMKELIRTGQGDLKSIQEKCIKLGVV